MLFNYILKINIMEKSTDKLIKSLFASFTIILLYFFATIGIVKIFWNTDDFDMLEGRVKFLFLMVFVVTAFLIFVPSNLLGHGGVEILFYAIFIIHALYLLVGILAYILRD